jgi:TrmH family RNA methyltransferase
MNISSRKNPSVKKFREISRERKAREEYCEFAVEGYKLCAEALDAGFIPTSAFVTESAQKKYPEICMALEKFGTDVITEDVSEYISDTKTPQGVFITVGIPEKKIDFKNSPNGKYILLDGLQDTGNIGTVIRTGEALGIDGVIVSKDCADIYSPKVVRGSMGSLFRLPVIKADLVATITEMKTEGYDVYAAMLDETAERLSEVKFGNKAAVIIGNEGNGVSEKVADTAGRKIYIPITSAESLNAAVAASIICWEMVK